MLLEKEYEIKTSKKNNKWLKNKGYVFTTGDIIIIKTEDLPFGSHKKVQVKCDVCDNEKEISFQKYIKNISNGGFYACSPKCAQKKVKITTKEKYGKDYYTQTKEYEKRMKNTCLEKYGVEHHTQNKEIKEKQKQTNLEKYGVEYYTQTNEYKEKYKILMLEKYGVENSFQSDLVKEKSKKTMLEKYGVEYFTQNEKFKEKIKEINYKKYGVENVSQSEKIKEKKIQTTLINYGVENPFQSEEIKDKIKVTCLEKYGVEYPSQNELIKKQRIKKYKNKILDKNKIEGLNIIKIKNKDNKNIYTINCEICNNNYNIEQSLLFNRKKYNTILCTICNPINSNISGLEIKMLDFIKENYNGVIVENSRDIIKPYELDVYLPELNLAFEFNGLYWHSELNKPNNYHKDKSNMCEEKNIQLIHIWEDDWIYKQDIIKSMILNKLKKTPNKFFARKCEIKEIKDNKLLKDFLNENHIQGFIGSSIKLGLFYDDELVSLMIFGKKRKFMNSKSKEGEYELLRFCNKLNTNVIGGASKLFKYFIKNYSFTEITTYADRSHSQGKLYETLGFNFISKTEPNYFYIINKIRKHRFSFRKDVLVKEGYDPNKTEHEIMLERKIYKIYNAGNLKFSFNI